MKNRIYTRFEIYRRIYFNVLSGNNNTNIATDKISYHANKAAMNKTEEYYQCQFTTDIQGYFSSIDLELQKSLKINKLNNDFIPFYEIFFLKGSHKQIQQGLIESFKLLNPLAIENEISFTWENVNLNISDFVKATIDALNLDIGTDDPTFDYKRSKNGVIFYKILYTAIKDFYLLDSIFEILKIPVNNVRLIEIHNYRFASINNFRFNCYDLTFEDYLKHKLGLFITPNL